MALQQVLWAKCLVVLVVLVLPVAPESAESERGWAKSTAGEITTLHIPTDLLPSAPYTDYKLDNDVFEGFNQPWGMARGRKGVFICDFQNHRVRVLANGTVHTVAGSGRWGAADGFGDEVEFRGPKAIALLHDGVTALVTDEGNDCVRRISLQTGAVTTVAGGAKAGFNDGVGTTAEFREPAGILQYDDATVLIADSKNNRIRKLDIDSALVTTVAGSGTAGHQDGVGTLTKLNFSTALAVSTQDSATVYFTDCYNHMIRSVNLRSGVVASVAGHEQPDFNFPQGLLYVDNVLLVADSFSFQVKMLDPRTGSVVSIAGRAEAGTTDGYGALAKFSQPTGLTLAGAAANQLIVADSSYSKLRLMEPLFPPRGASCQSGQFIARGNVCRHCNTSACGIGSYRKPCRDDLESSDGSCTSCTNFLPLNAHYSAPGVPFDFNNCSWTCDVAFTVTRHCTDCSEGHVEDRQCTLDCTPSFLHNGTACALAAETSFFLRLDTVSHFLPNECITLLARALSVDPDVVKLEVMSNEPLILTVRVLSSSRRTDYIRSMLHTDEFKQVMVDGGFPIVGIWSGSDVSHGETSDENSGLVPSIGNEEQDTNGTDAQHSPPPGPGVVSDAKATKPLVISGALIGSIIGTCVVLFVMWRNKEYILLRMEAYHQTLEDSDSDAGNDAAPSQQSSADLQQCSILSVPTNQMPPPPVHPPAPAVVSISVAPVAPAYQSLVGQQDVVASAPVDAVEATAVREALSDALEPTHLLSALGPSVGSGPEEATLPQCKGADSWSSFVLADVKADQDLQHVAPRKIIMQEISFDDISIAEAQPSHYGSAKTIWKAVWREKAGADVRPVLVVVMSNEADIEKERHLFQTIGKHAHLTQMIATSRFGHSNLECLVLEHSSLGALDEVLRGVNATDKSVKDLVCITIAKQLHSAMIQLTLHEVVHKDLAARNVLVFGFDASDRAKIYVKLSLSLAVNGSSSSGVPSAKRWMAPESISQGLYSEKSDVFQFGIVTWEIWSGGNIPFRQVENEEEIGSQIVSGRRLPSPSTCPDRVWDMVQLCWRAQPAQRPSFMDLNKWLEDAHVSIAASEIRAVDRGQACVICLERCPVVALLPCGHRVLCDDEVCMGLKITDCPICRQKVQSRVRIYDP